MSSSLHVECVDCDTPAFHVENEHFVIEKKEEHVEEKKEDEYSYLKISHILFNLKEKIFEISENNKNIKIQETEHPDKYQIVIDIYKDIE